MSPLSCRRTKRTLALAAVCVLCAASTAAPRDDDYIARGIRLLRALYPGLHHVVAVIGDTRDLDVLPPAYPDAIYLFWINLFHDHCCDPGPRKPSEPLLSADFNFDPERRLLKHLWVSGPFLTGRLDKLRTELDEHPDWPDARLVQALKAAGAKYGPDDQAAFLRALPLKELEPYTGPLEVVSTEFDVRLPVYKGEKPKADLTWWVEAKWHSADGRLEARRTMTFEPFDGALMRYDIRGPGPAWGTPR